MDLSEYLYVFRKYWKSIVAVTLLVVGAAAAYSLLATPTYTSSTSLFFAVRSADTIGEVAQGSTYTERQVNSFAQIAETPLVLQPVIDDLGLDVSAASLAARVSVTAPDNTSIINLSVTDTNAQRAADLAGGIAESLVVAVGDISPRDASDRPVVEATVTSPANVPTSWTSPNVTRIIALALILGLLLGFGQALLRQVLDRKVRTSADVARVTDIPVIGTVAVDGKADTRTLAMLDDPESARAEDYRRLRTAMRFLGVDGRARVFVISSSIAGEGKSTTALNLAHAMAAAHMKVLLIDADLRRPTIATRLNLEDAAGLTTVLIGRAFLNEVVQPVAKGLDVLTSGKIPPNPSELLGSDAIRQLIAEVAESYDYVLIDSAPLVAVTDTSALATHVDGVILVAGSGDVAIEQMDAAIDSVAAANGSVVGIVLNKVRAQDIAYRSAYYAP